VAQGRLLDVPRHERRQAAGPRDERLVEQPQLHRAPGQPHGADSAHEPGHGRRRRHHRRRHRREGDPEMSPTDFKRRQISGRGIPVTGNDIDTDRIIPARFLKAVTFEGMGEHAFEDARKQNPEHPFNQKVYEGASVLVVGQNFGCGSSREHAPQALMRWGIRAIVGGSFAEIFFGNCVMLGIPCLRASQEDVEWLQKAIAKSPQVPVTVDVEKQEVHFGDHAVKATLPDGARNQLVGGTWDSTAVLLEAGALGAAPEIVWLEEDVKIALDLGRPTRSGAVRAPRPTRPGSLTTSPRTEASHQSHRCNDSSPTPEGASQVDSISLSFYGLPVPVLSDSFDRQPLQSSLSLEVHLEV